MPENALRLGGSADRGPGKLTLPPVQKRVAQSGHVQEQTADRANDEQSEEQAKNQVQKLDHAVNQTHRKTEERLPGWVERVVAGSGIM